MKALIALYVAVLSAMAALYFMGGGMNQRFLVATSVAVLALALALLAQYLVRLRK